MVFSWEIVSIFRELTINHRIKRKCHFAFPRPPKSQKQWISKSDNYVQSDCNTHETKRVGKRGNLKLQRSAWCMIRPSQTIKKTVDEADELIILSQQKRYVLQNVKLIRVFSSRLMALGKTKSTLEHQTPKKF